MKNKSKYTIYKLYFRIIIVLFIVLLIVSNFTIGQIFDKKLEKENALLVEQLNVQKNALDEGIAIIYNDIYLQRDWLEKILEGKVKTSINKSLVDNITFDKELLVSTMQEEDRNSLGNIIVNGNIANIENVILDEIDNLSSFMEFMEVIKNNSQFDFWTTYYSGNEYILSYPYIDADLSIGNRQELFNTINTSIEQVKENATDALLKNGWETDLFLDDTETMIMFTKFLPVLNQDNVVGIIGNNIDIGYLKNNIIQNNGKGALYIIDQANNIVYKDSTTVSDLENFKTLLESKYSIKNSEKAIDNEGIYSQNNYKTYTYPLENINWKMIYIINQDIFKVIERNKTLISIFCDSVLIIILLILLYFLSKYQQKVKEIDEQKTNFLRMVSHDLKTPLSSIIGFTERTKKRLEKSIYPLIKDNQVNKSKELKKIHRNFEIIKQEGERLNKLISNLLQMSKVESGQSFINKEKVNIKVLINNCVESLKPLIEEKHLDIIIDMDTSLNDVMVDKYYLSQVLINLIGNAVNYTEAGYIRVSAENNLNSTLFEVEDSGIGIHEKELTQIFDPFYQADRRNQKGSGLGLAICDSIVRMHGGSIWVKSILEKGSQFYFTIPYSDSMNERRNIS